MMLTLAIRGFVELVLSLKKEKELVETDNGRRYVLLLLGLSHSYCTVIHVNLKVQSSKHSRYT
jgi:hypothetical protein